MWMLCSDGNKHSKCLLPRIPEICKPRFSGALCLYVCRSDPRFIPPYFMREKSISYLISPHIWSLPNQNKSFILIQTSSYHFKHFTLLITSSLYQRFCEYFFSKEQRFNSGGLLLLKSNILLSESSEAAIRRCSKTF